MPIPGFLRPGGQTPCTGGFTILTSHGNGFLKHHLNEPSRFQACVPQAQPRSGPDSWEGAPRLSAEAAEGRCARPRRRGWGCRGEAPGGGGRAEGSHPGSCMEVPSNPSGNSHCLPVEGQHRAWISGLTGGVCAPQGNQAPTHPPAPPHTASHGAQSRSCAELGSLFSQGPCCLASPRTAFSGDHLPPINVYPWVISRKIACVWQGQQVPGGKTPVGMGEGVTWRVRSCLYRCAVCLCGCVDCVYRMGSLCRLCCLGVCVRVCKCVCM